MVLAGIVGAYSMAVKMVIFVIKGWGKERFGERWKGRVSLSVKSQRGK